VKVSPSLNLMPCPATIALIILIFFIKTLDIYIKNALSFTIMFGPRNIKLFALLRCGLEIHSAVTISFQTLTRSFEQRGTFLFLISNVVVVLLSLFITMYASYVDMILKNVCRLKSQFLMVSICLLAITTSCLIVM
jgi:hypothetical protein